MGKLLSLLIPLYLAGCTPIPDHHLDYHAALHREAVISQASVTYSPIEDVPPPQKELVARSGEPEGIILRDQLLRWGASNHEAQGLVPTSDFTCYQPGASLPGVLMCRVARAVTFGDGTSYNVTLMFYDNRLYGWYVNFDSDKFSFFADTMEKRLGKPTKTDGSTVQNRMGADFDQTVMEWELSQTKATVTRRSRNVTQGEVEVLHTPISRQVKTGSGVAPF